MNIEFIVWVDWKAFEESIRKEVEKNPNAFALIHCEEGNIVIGPKVELPIVKVEIK